jgi:GH24 family phage-related lysozyme (muramidase)
MITKTLFYVFTFIMLLLPIETKECSIENHKEIINIETLLDYYYEANEQKIRSLVSNKIKKYEGLRLKPYNCSAGHRTIGYGHILKAGVDDHLRNGCTKEQADSLFEVDLNFVAKYLKKNLNIRGYRLYSMVSFSFNLGPFYITTKKNCELDSLIKNNLSIEKEIVKYCYYKSPKTKKYVRLEGLYKRRLWELNIYNKHDSIVNNLLLKS